jgi:hypothetical protein
MPDLLRNTSLPRSNARRLATRNAGDLMRVGGAWSNEHVQTFTVARHLFRDCVHAIESIHERLNTASMCSDFIFFRRHRVSGSASTVPLNSPFDSDGALFPRMIVALLAFTGV